MSKYFELNKKKSKAGRVPFKQVLHEIYPNNKQWNINGISWQKDETLQNLDSVSGMPLVCQFLDSDNQIPFGSHGEVIIENDEVSFEDSLVVGSFEKAYIDENLEINGEKKCGLVGEGYIYSQRFPHLVNYLQEQYSNGNTIDSSIEICADKSSGYSKIVYKDNKLGDGRIPEFYQYSGSALCIGEPPADNSAIMLELNSAKSIKSQELNNINSYDYKNKENKEDEIMDEKVIAQIVDSVKSTIVETNSKNSELEAKISELNSQIVEINTPTKELKKALAEVEAERAELYKKVDESYAEANILREEIAKSKIKERVSELNSVLADYSDVEKDFAKVEIEAFNADPMAVEINSIVDKICREIVKQAKETEKTVETNSKKEEVKLEDIFGDIVETNSKNNEEISIF